MGIEISTDFGNLDSKFSQAAITRGRKAAAMDAMQAMNHYFVPMLHTDSNTNLRSMSNVTADGSAIQWNAVYAKAQFYGIVGGKYPVNNYTTPGTSKRWDLRWKGRQDLVNNAMQSFVNGAGWNG